MASDDVKIMTSIDLPVESSSFSEKTSQSLLKLDLRNLRDIIFVEDMDFNLIYASTAAEAIFGYTAKEMKGLEKKDYMTPDSLKKAMESFQRYCALYQENADVDIPLMEYEYVRKDGSTFWGELQVNFIWDEQGQLIGCQGILRDIDKRKKIEKNWFQSEERFRTLFDLTPQAIALTEIETGKLIDVNQMYCDMTQYEKYELIGKTTTELGFCTSSDRDRFIQELSTHGEVRYLELDFQKKDGSILNTQMFSRILGVNDRSVILTTLYDKTNERRLERQFLQAQKMESIATLSGSIAHDFNNFLMGIDNYVTLLLAETDYSGPNYHNLMGIYENVNNCHRLTRQLLGYAKKEIADFAPFIMNHLINETSDSLKSVMQNISMFLNLNPDLRAIKGDKVQIKQVLYNLFINAADAMPKGGELSIKTSNVSYQEMQGRAYKPKKKDYVGVVITDTGVGMDQKILDHIFEPFFTTKGKTKGTGLGLASVYGIVKGHRGYIDVESKEGRGTTFRIYFPASS